MRGGTDTRTVGCEHAPTSSAIVSAAFVRANRPMAPSLLLLLIMTRRAPPVRLAGSGTIRRFSMALIVQKFGGTSVGSVERIKNVARRVAKWKAAGHDLVVVPSAMAGETNRLIALAGHIQSSPDARELDVVASTGEQVTIGLLAMALIELGVKAKSYTGWQVKVKTNSAFTKARISSIDVDKMRADLAAGRVMVVAGFQGVDDAGNITTLGRGGSDTSAVALAAALQAHECHIYTDVDGIYTTDPRLVPEARRLHTITFEEMLEMAGAGSKVLQIRSVEFAGKYKVPTRVLSSLTDRKSTRLNSSHQLIS